MGNKILFTFVILVYSSTLACGLPKANHPLDWDLTKFVKTTESPSVQRQISWVEQLLSGNIPAEQLKFQPVLLEAVINNHHLRLQFMVSSDYIRMGTEEDSMVVPLTNYAAQTVASRWGYYLPTARLVDAIWKNSNAQLSPQPTDWYKYPGAMRSASNYVIYEERIQNQLQLQNGLISGHRKDVVITERLNSKPTKVAIYGWMRTNGTPIQSLSTVHDYEYEDYSHGIRLVDPNVVITDIQSRVSTTSDYASLLKDPSYKSVLGDTLTDQRAARKCPQAFANYFGLSSANCPEPIKSCL